MRPPRGEAIMVAMFMSCLVLACADTTTHPFQPEPRADAVAAAGSVLPGCGQFEVRLRGLDSIVVTPVDRPACGPIHPVLAGKPTFDRTTGRVRLPIALENVGSASVRAPARLYGWEDSLTVLAPPGLKQNQRTQSYLSLLGYDSTLADTAPAYANARVWRFDSLLGAADTAAPLLRAGGQSRPRVVEVSMLRGVEAFAVTVWAQARRASPPVPALPPDSVPKDLLADSNLVSANGVRMVRGIVTIWFREGASQSERQEAVDAISGEVVGGYRLALSGDGVYLVRIPGPGDPDQLRQAVEMLRRMPQVKHALEELIIETHWRIPRDGAGWQQWQTNPDSATGPNWAPEAVAAPFAWGCDLGDSTVPLAVVDIGMQSVADITPAGHPRLGLSPHDQHGVAVTSVIAARGDNGLGMAGMLWRAHPMLYEASVSPEDPTSQPTLSVSGAATGNLHLTLLNVLRAGRDGAAIINLSLGLPPNTDSVAARGSADQLVSALRMLESEGHDPLVVVSAGNGHRDARRDGFAGARDSLPTQVIVVAAGARSLRALESHSDTGSAVDIVAPGDSIQVTLGDGSLGLGFETSFATPFVTGVAGLLLSFDPTLSTPALKNLILDGARRAGRTLDGKPLLNAYESLRLAAERTGAPLCGNRVWSANGQIVAQRNRALNTSEPLFTDGDSASYLRVFHGGRRIEFLGQHTGSRAIVYRQGAWREIPMDSTESRTTYGGAYLSFLQVSHNIDSAVIVRRSATGFDVSILEFATGHQETIATVPGTWSASGDTTCIIYNPWWVPACTSIGIGTTVTSYAKAAFSPRGDRVFVAVSGVSATSSVTSTSDCSWYVGGPPIPQCEQLAGSATSAGATIYAINIHGDRTPRAIRALAGEEIVWVAGSEDGTEIQTGRGTFTSTSVTTVTSAFGWISYSTTILSGGRSNCGLTYTSLATGADATPPVPTADVCASQEGEGTFAPVITAR